MILLVSLLAAAAATAECPADAAVLRADMAAAEQAYDDWAWDEFDAAVQAVRADLDCLSEVLSPKDAQAAHRLFALAGARQQDEAMATASFKGLAQLDPSYAPDLTLAPEGSLLRRAWDTAVAEGAGAGRPLPDGAWFIDSVPKAVLLPTERAAVVQLLDSGAGFRSWYIDGSKLPHELEAMLTPTATGPSSSGTGTSYSATVPTSHASRTMLFSGLALAAVGVGGVLGGEVLENRMDQTDDLAQAESLYKAGLGTTFGGMGLAAAGSGLVIGAVIKGSW